MVEQPHQHRKAMDSSLETERGRTDHELAARSAAIESDTDQAVTSARERARRFLAKVRDQHDLDLAEATPEARAAAAWERESGDRAAAASRAAARTELEVERARRNVAIAHVLELERENTDRALAAEREWTDRSIAARDDILGVVSHDLRGLLGAVSVNAALIAAAAPMDESGRALVVGAAAIERSVARMTRLAGDLLDFARIEAKALALETRQGDVGSVLHEVATTFEALAAQGGVSLTVNGRGDGVAVFDYDRVFQVVTNLVANAIRHAGPAGRVELSLRAAAEQVEVAVADTGPGIATEDRERIFQRFVTGAGGGDRKRLGLGLYIARHIVDAHGGRIWVDSAPGAGATFRFTLPTAARA